MTYLSVLILFLAMTIGGAGGRQECGCAAAKVDDVPHGANEAVTIIGDKVKEMRGTVTDAYGSELNDVVVELYEVALSEKKVDAYRIVASKKRLAACVTGQDGQFCFDDLPSGRYVLHAGTRMSAGISDTYMMITLHRKRQSGKITANRGLRLELYPGG